MTTISNSISLDVGEHLRKSLLYCNRTLNMSEFKTWEERIPLVFICVLISPIYMGYLRSTKPFSINVEHYTYYYTY